MRIEFKSLEFDLPTIAMLATLFSVLALFLLSWLVAPEGTPTSLPAGALESAIRGPVYLPWLQMNSDVVERPVRAPGFLDSVRSTILSHFQTLVYLPVLVLLVGFLCWYLFSRPSSALLVFIYALPLHILILTILIAQFNVPLGWARFIAAWKEILLGSLLLAVLVRAIVEKQTLRLNFLDLIALLWLSQIVIYLLLPAWGKSDTNWVARLYGARDWLLYLVPYFAGRLIPMPGRTAQRVLTAILIVGGVTSIVGIVDYFFVPLDWHVRLGVPRYYGDFLNLEYPDYNLGLPENYWVGIGGTLVRRAVSFYFSGQGFAIPFLIILPVAFLNYLQHRNWMNLGLFCVCSGALLLTITRLTIVACLIQVFLLVMLVNRNKAILAGLTLTVIFLSIVVILNPTLSRFVSETVALQDPSSQVRPAQWRKGIELLQENPFGLGLGSTGQVSARFQTGTLGAGSEAGYFKVSGALGWPGLAFFLAWFAGVIAYAALAIRHFPDYRKSLGVIVLVVAIGYLINNLTAPPDQIPFVIYIFPWLAGTAVQFTDSIVGLSNLELVNQPA